MYTVILKHTLDSEFEIFEFLGFSDVLKSITDFIEESVEDFGSTNEVIKGKYQSDHGVNYINIYYVTGMEWLITGISGSERDKIIEHFEQLDVKYS